MAKRFSMTELKSRGIFIEGNVGKRLSLIPQVKKTDINKLVKKLQKEADNKLKSGKIINRTTETPCVKIDIKPLSVNAAWKGRRFKSEEYKTYEKAVLSVLPELNLPKIPYAITFTFAFSNMASDFDNPTKLITDLLQKKYKFNDKNIMEAHIYKKVVPKGEEYFEFFIKHLEL